MDGTYEPKLYRIQLKGHLDKGWSDWFEGMIISYEDDTTILEGEVADNSSLHIILTRINDLNLSIISLVQIQCNNTEQFT